MTALFGPTRARELQLTTAQLCKEQLGETECSTRAIQLKSFQLTNAQLCLIPAAWIACFTECSTRARVSFQLTPAQFCFATLWLKASQTAAAATAAGKLQVARDLHRTATATAAGKLQVAGDLRSTAAASVAGKLQVAGDLRSTAAVTATGKLQVAGDLRSPESIHYEPLPQTMQSYLALDVHDMYMDLCNVVQNNLAGKGPDPAGAEELRYKNVFPNLTTGSVDLVVQAETSSHPERPAINGVKGEVGFIDFRGGRSTTFLFKFVATFIMAVWANLPFSLWPGMGMNASFAYTIVGFKGQSNPVKKVMFADAIEGVIFIVMSSLDIRRMIFKIFPAWMMTATMAGIGMFLAFIGLQSGKGIDIIRDHHAVLVDLVEELPGGIPHLAERELQKCSATLAVQLRKLHEKLRNHELEDNYDLHEWIRELEKYCEELTKIDRHQKAKVHSKFRNVLLAKVHCKLRNENEKDNELEKNFENMIFKKKLVPLLLDRHFALAASFQLYGYKAWKEFREASIEIVFYKMLRDKELRHQHRRDQLDYKAFWSGSFKALCLSNFDDNSYADSSLEEETFEKGTSDDSSLEESSFEESSLEDETSKKAASKTAAWKTPASKTAAWKTPASKTAAWKTPASKTAAWKTAAWKKAVSKRTASETAVFKKTAWQTGAFRDELRQLSFQSLSEQLCTLSLHSFSATA